MVKKVMVTGVAGLIGNVVWRMLLPKTDKYELYGLARRFQASARVGSGETLDVPEDRWRLVDVAEFDAVRRALEGMDVVVHMAADPRGDAPWESVIRSNITGAYNVFEACRLNKVKRVIYASSVMVSWGYQFDEPYKAMVEGRCGDNPPVLPTITKESAVRPTDLYPCSKVWGEALARYYSDIHGISAICLRIGHVRDPDIPYETPLLRSVWCSQRDIVQVVERCIDATENLSFDIFYGISDNKDRFMDIEHAREVLGYIPQDSS